MHCRKGLLWGEGLAFVGLFGLLLSVNRSPYYWLQEALLSISNLHFNSSDHTDCINPSCRNSMGWVSALNELL